MEVDRQRFRVVQYKYTKRGDMIKKLQQRVVALFLNSLNVVNSKTFATVGGIIIKLFTPV